MIRLTPMLRILVVLSAAVACADLREILTLQRALSLEFPNNAINVNVTNNVSLTVTFSNSSLAQLPDSEQARVAWHVAEVVRDHYAGYSHLETINVGFMTVKGGGGFTVRSTSIPYHFTPQQLGPPVPDAKPAVPKA